MNDTLPPLRRLIAFAVLLPAAVVACDIVLLKNAPAEWLPSLLYPAMIASAALLSWCAGRYVRPFALGWEVFAWSLILLDVIAAELAGHYGNRLGYALVSTQITLLIVWAI